MVGVGTVTVPVKEAPDAPIPALNVLSPVNVFAPSDAPVTAPVMPLNEATVVLVRATVPTTSGKLIV